MRYLPFVVLPFVFLFDCCSENNGGSIANDFKGFATYTIDLKTAMDSANFLDYIDTSLCDAIVLESKEGFLIGKIQNIAYRGDTIIIVDSQTKSILLFDKNGKAISRICHIGRAKGEYADIYASYISDNKVYVFDSQQWRIVCYDFDDNLLSVFDYSGVHSLAEYNDTIFADKWWYGTLAQGNFVDLLTSDGTLIKNEIHKKTTESEKTFMHLCQSFLISYPENLLYWVDFDDMVFKYSDGMFKPYYKLEYADEIKVPRSEINKGLDYLYESKYANGYVWYTNSILETTNYIFIGFDVRYNTKSLENYKYVVNKNTGETLLTQKLYDGDVFGVSGLIQDGEYFSSFLRGEDVQYFKMRCESADPKARFSHLTMDKCVKLAEKVKETDNGILFKKKIK